jgi:nucleotide-binding universal stress UspA family protein
MKRILVAIDASNFKNSLVDFACYLARLTQSRLTGMFYHFRLEPATMEKLRAEVFAEEDEWHFEIEEQKEEYPRAITLFKEFCSSREVNCDVHIDGEIPIEELIAETRYADLVVADPTITFTNKAEVTPTAFLRELLARAECPVVVAPESFDWVNEIVFAYDGSRSSVFAIKQFTYMFPELNNRKVLVLEVCEGEDHVVTAKERLSAWLHNNYSDINYLVLHGKPKDELFGYLLGKENMLVVMGSFGRPMLSSLFSKSNAELLLKVVNLPFFIIHC